MCETDELEVRSEQRTNLFLMASLSAPSGSGPVKVRNLSPAGALVESVLLPSIGERVTLSRGSLEASGEVVWLANGRAGLLFSGRVTIADWLPGGQNQKRQQRADELFQRLKAELPHRDDPSTSLCLSSELPDSSDLEELAGRLDMLAEALADNDVVLTLYTTKLQILDAAAQALRKLAATKG